MEEKKIEFIYLDEGVPELCYGTPGSAAIDVTAHSIITAYKGEKEIEDDKLLKMQESFERSGYIKMRGNERILFGTGLKVKLPKNKKLEVKPRSGFSLKKGLQIMNAPGTIDSDYKGEIGIILGNNSPYLIQVDKDERIAQIEPDDVIKVEGIKILKDERGEEGFGSTGKS